MKGSIKLRKLTAVSLCAALLCGSMVSLQTVLSESNINAGAVSSAITYTSGNIKEYGDYTYSVENNKATILRYKGNSQTVNIPEKINGITVKTIGAQSFYGADLKSIKIPETVTEIDAYAFAVSRLTAITIPKSVVKIGVCAFKSAENLKNVSIPDSVVEVGVGAFEDTPWYNSKANGDVYIGKAYYSCKGKIANGTVSIKKGTKSISQYAFADCNNIKSIIIPNGVSTIGEGAFNNCSSLKKISFPEDLVHLGQEAFSGTPWANSLPKGDVYIGKIYYKYNGTLSKDTVVIKDGTRGIADWAFSEGCDSMKKIELPDSLEVIGSYAFSGCPKMTSISLPKNIKEIYPGLGWAKPTSDGSGSAASTVGLIKGFTIKGYTGTVAESYAKAYGLKFVSLSVQPVSITLNKTSMTLGKGETTKLNATIAPSNTTNKTVSWRTSDSKILTVDKNGNVKAVNNGTAWVTAKTVNGIEKSCRITVKNAPSRITLTKGVVTIGVGEKFSVGSAVPDGSAAAKRTYRTSNSGIVKMTRTDWQGDFVGVKPGTAYVTVRTYNGKESTCKVTVKAAPSVVTISKRTLTMKVGQTAALSCSVPSNAGCATRTYRTSNSSVVKMTNTNWTGKFKAVKKGTAYVTVRTYNGKESSCKITVV